MLRATALRALAAAGFVGLSCGCATHPESAVRAADWAEPVVLAGVPNLHRVSEELYRSAQPTETGMVNLRLMGIKTVVNLRSLGSDCGAATGAGLACESIPMQAWRVDREDAVKFLRITTDPARVPVLVHCRHGADRTGVMSALYRVAVQGWPKGKAIREMLEGGFGFHSAWKNLPAWLRRSDIEAIKKEAAAAGQGV